MSYKNPLPPPSVAIPKIIDATSLPPHIERAGAVAMFFAVMSGPCMCMAVLIYGLWSLQ